MLTNTSCEELIIPAFVYKGIVPLPNVEMTLEVQTEEGFSALDNAMDTNKYFALFVPERPDAGEIGPGSIVRTGLICHIKFDSRKKPVRLVAVDGVVRCVIKEFIEYNPFWLVKVATLPITSDNLEAELAYVKMLLKDLEKDNAKILAQNNKLASIISKGVTADKLADLLAFYLPLDYKAKLRYLTNPNVTKRLEYLAEDLKREKLFKELDQKIENEVRNSISESQKEYYLREKMRAIQDELGDKVRKESDIDELRSRIEKKKLPPAMNEKALGELARYASLSAASGESAICRTYLDFIISLPWNEASKDNNDIKKAKEQLDSDHYGLQIVKERILEYLAVRIMTKKNPQAILCLVGPPGVGKTSLARSIATSLNKKFVKQSLGGVKDESEIRGHRRTYLGALPGRILQGMKKASVNNPVFLLDEVDKLTSDYRGDPASALLEVLDAEQNKYFSDHYLEEAYDLSNVFFIATANYLENIPAPLRDRMEVVQLSSYTEYEKYEIAKRHLLPKQLDNHGVDGNKIVITDNVIWRIIREYTKEAGVREVERIIGTLIRKAIKTLLMGTDAPINIDENNLEEWLGKPKYTYNKIDTIDQIGVVTGLAYTQYGGDTLPVEVTYYKGQGKLVLTGKLGDVMKESAQAALSYVRANALKYGIDESKFTDHDIHLHVPEGAVPKDGPSAGVAIATAIISALSHRFVHHDIGMTGEITLRGRVLPIGGIREKSIAAHRSGLQKILIPKENLLDLPDIPESVRNELEIVAIETIDDVVKNAII